MSLYIEKDFQTIRKLMAESEKKSINFNEKDYECIIQAKKTGNWKEVYKLDFYKNHGGEYCFLLQQLEYHKIRLIFVKENDKIAVYNKDRIFNTDYLKIATIDKNKQIFFHTLTIYPEEKREINIYIGNL